MNFPITIGITSDGMTIVGAKYCKRYECHVTEKVYAVQIKHRCAALLVEPSGGEAWYLCTPTYAKKRNAKMIRMFR